VLGPILREDRQARESRKEAWLFVEERLQSQCRKAAHDGIEGWQLSKKAERNRIEERAQRRCDEDAVGPD
jgi:hypothetical protein